MLGSEGKIRILVYVGNTVNSLLTPLGYIVFQHFKGGSLEGEPN